MREPDLNEVKLIVIIWLWGFYSILLFIIILLFDNFNSCLSKLQMSFLFILLIFVSMVLEGECDGCPIHAEETWIIC